MNNDLIVRINDNILNKAGNVNSRLLDTRHFIESQLNKDILKATSFLNDTCKYSERIYCILNKLNSTPTCICGNELKYRNALKLGYSNTCSNICSRKTNPWKTCSDTKKEERKKFIEAVFDTPKIIFSKEDILVNLQSDKYNPTENIELSKNIIRYTDFLPKFNGKGASANTISWTERIYCLKHNITTPPICKCGNLLSFENSSKGYIPYCKNECKVYHDTVEIIKSITNFNITEAPTKLKDNNITLQCKKCNGVLERKLTNARWKTITCPICMQKYGSKSQFELFEYINSNNKILNTRSVIGLELDIYLPENNLAIEFNGNYWHSELQGKDKKYHLNKTKLCSNKNIQLLHILESEWISKQDIWKSMINSKLKNSTKIFARKCIIKEVPTTEKCEFLDINHLQGRDRSNVNLGLYYNGELVSLMTFCKSRFNKNYEWELSRFASKLNTTVVGGASKLLSHFIKNYNPSSIISYADRRHSNGNLYTQLGFIFSHYSNPNYFYVKKNNYYNLLSRQQFQKHKLKDKLEIFDSKLSEWENMKLNDYDRIWDCGNSVWVFNKTNFNNLQRLMF